MMVGYDFGDGKYVCMSYPGHPASETPAKNPTFCAVRNDRNLPHLWTEPGEAE